MSFSRASQRRLLRALILRSPVSSILRDIADICFEDGFAMLRSGGDRAMFDLRDWQSVYCSAAAEGLIEAETRARELAVHKNLI